MAEQIDIKTQIDFLLGKVGELQEAIDHFLISLEELALRVGALEMRASQGVMFGQV